ncbi:MAG: dienelactone hydrolase family protein [Gammaproteobacteria bacterium]
MTAPYTERTLEYRHEDSLLEAFVCAPAGGGRRPAVLVSHAWAGRSPFECDKARALADLGYVGIAIDLYGKGVLGGSVEENGALMKPFLDNRALLQARLHAALAAARTDAAVDGGRVAAMGFCFGGLCVLDLARSGADVRGGVSFHGLLGKPGNTDGRRIAAKILVLHGHDDPMVPPDDVLAFEQEMTAAGADWQVHAYGHTLHAFTNPEADDPSFGVKFDANANRRSWRSLVNFLEEVLG